MSVATVCEEVFSCAGGADSGLEGAACLGLGVLDTLASRRSKSCESSLRLGMRLGGTT